MNLQQGLETERTSCTEVHQVLAHVGIFRYLVNEFFLTIDVDDEKFKTREGREKFISEPSNFEIIVRGFSTTYDIDRAVLNDIVGNYSRNKNLFDRVGIGEKEKNLFSAIVNVLRNFDVKEIQATENLEEEVKKRVGKILNDTEGQEVIGNIRGEIVNKDDTFEMEIGGRKIKRAGRGFFFVDTRQELFLDGVGPIVEVENKDLPKGIICVRCLNGGIYDIKEDFSILKINGSWVIGLKKESNQYFGEICKAFYLSNKGRVNIYYLNDGTILTDNEGEIINEIGEKVTFNGKEYTKVVVSGVRGYLDKNKNILKTSNGTRIINIIGEIDLSGEKLFKVEISLGGELKAIYLTDMLEIYEFSTTEKIALIWDSISGIFKGLLGKKG